MVAFRGLAFSAGVFLVLAFGAVGAEAAQRYASTTGSGTACTSAAPCDIVQAFNGSGAGDEVIVSPGTYTATDSLYAPPNGSAHGIAGQPRPVINSSQVNALNQNGADLVSDLVINHVGSTTAFSVSGPDAVAERLDVVTTGAYACSVTSGALLRDSTCVNNKATGVGNRLGVYTATNSTPTTAELRNVTAVATGTGSYAVQVLAEGSGVTATIGMRNVIAIGAQADVQALGAVGGTATANLAYSAFDSSSVSGAGTVTPFSAQHNISNPPSFVDAGAGDYHQAEGSPTINAGSADDKTGSLDFDGESRVQGASIDIGADEFPEDTAAPETTIAKGPKKRTTSTKATFKFSSDDPAATFECKLDRGGFAPCTSPKKLTHLKKGKRTFSVRATDASDNADPSPAVYKWTVKKKPRRH